MERAGPDRTLTGNGFFGSPSFFLGDALKLRYVVGDLLLQFRRKLLVGL